MRETLIHYTDKPLLAVRSVEQDGHGGKRFDKPKGLWVSVKGEDDWRTGAPQNRLVLVRLPIESR